MAEKKNNIHELQWMKLESEFVGLSLVKDDEYDRRSQSCTSLLSQFCNI